jgi:serine/threonine-protein kinase HipA
MMNRRAKVFLHDTFTGVLSETDVGYEFLYDEGFVKMADAQAISKTLVVSTKPYRSKVLFPFFDGLIPEGWLLDIAIDNWKINGRDRFGLLLACCKNSIGAVSILAQDDEEL